MSLRTSSEIGLSEQAANSLLSVGGAGGLVLGAWILRRGGIPAEQIARRTVAFFLLTSLANFSFLAVGGLALATGVLAGPSDRLLLGAIPALVAIAAIVLAVAAGGVARALGPRLPRPRVQATLRAIGDGVSEAGPLLRSPAVAIGSSGYMLFDIAVLGVCFPAFGNPLPPVDALLLAYIIGQLGGLIPLPGGIGGLDLGLLGALVLYGVNAADATVAVLAYRGLFLVVPAAVGLPAWRPSGRGCVRRTTTSERAYPGRRSKCSAQGGSGCRCPLPGGPIEGGQLTLGPACRVPRRLSPRRRGGSPLGSALRYCRCSEASSRKAWNRDDVRTKRSFTHHASRHGVLGLENAPVGGRA
jgi:uncharacterized membrane protein YbhN (UPF0104 family)